MVNSELALGPTRIVVGRGLLEGVGERIRSLAPAHRYAIITDSNVGPLYAERVRAELGSHTIDVLTVPAGENYKSRDSWASLTDQMLVRGFGRDSAVIALGGGVIGDLAGFVASTYMRGIPVVQVPTTLLAMIDASIGGKTGIDTPAGKNLVGTFHHPKGVIVELQVLESLPLSERRAGLAEAIKHGVIADESYLFDVVGVVPDVVGTDGAVSDRMLSVIVRSIQIKADIVSRDEREEGLRQILNFGHTIGHAVELLSGYSLHHGEAVAIGMAVESRLAEHIGVAQTGTADKVAEVLRLAGLPIELPPDFGVDAILEAMRSDKKVRTGTIRLSLPARIGAMAGAESGWTVSVGDDQLREVLA